MKEVLNKLEEGKQYTIALINDFGFPSGFNFTFCGGEVKPYAQYKESLILWFKKPRQRNKRGLRFLPCKSFVIWEGFEKPDTEMFKENTGDCLKASYFGFDRQYLIDAINSVEKKPIIIFNVEDHKLTNLNTGKCAEILNQGAYA